jgi:putative ABC transport system permease protein
MLSLWQDLRFGSRLLIKERWFTIAAAIALALGIGANNTVFTLVNAVLLRGLPFAEPDRIMWVGTHDTRGREFGMSLQDFEDWRTASRTFAGLVIAWNTAFNVSEEGQVPEHYFGSYVSANAFQVIGEQPIVGRNFRPDDDRPGAPAVVLISSNMWKLRYGADPAVIGRTIRTNELPTTVIGVMRDGMRFPGNSELWLTTAQLAALFRAQGRGARFYQAFGRLAPGVTVEQARAELANVAAQLARDFPVTNKDVTATVVPYLDRTLGPQTPLLFWSLMGAVGFVLVIACANVATLLLARAAHRVREISVRVALGATRWRVVRQLLVESVLLAMLSGLFGLALSVIGIRWFDDASEGIGRPDWMVFSMDARVFAFFAALCLATGLLFGLAPALYLSNTNIYEALKEGGRLGSGGMRARRWTATLIVTELALTLVLLAGAGFMMRSFLALYRLDLGVDTSRLVTMQLIMPSRKYPSLADRTAFLQRIDERLGTVPTIMGAATASNIPLGGGMPRRLSIDGRPDTADLQAPVVTMLSVSASYFDALGVRLLQGRPFNERDGTPGYESVIINQRLAKMHFAGQNAIGQRIRLTDDTPGALPSGWVTIVGVAPTVRQRNVQDPDPDPVAYIPHLLNVTMARGGMLIIRTRMNPGQMVSLVREEVRGLDPDMPLYNIQTMDEFLAQQRWTFRVFGTMFVVFAAIALFLSAVGLYSVTAYAVSQRTQEIGLHMALGAAPRQVWWLVLRRGFVQLALGLAFGLAGAIGVGRLLRSLLAQTGSTDPLTLGSVVLVLLLVGVAACVWPARRATRLNPMVALHSE